MAGPEPENKRVMVFVDGQNFFRHAKEAFGYHYPNFDIQKLANAVVAVHADWTLSACYFYTGMPDATADPGRNGFWTKKLAAMGRQRIKVFTRPIRYRNKSVVLQDGTTHPVSVAEEKESMSVSRSTLSARQCEMSTMLRWSSPKIRTCRRSRVKFASSPINVTAG